MLIICDFNGMKNIYGRPFLCDLTCLITIIASHDCKTEKKKGKKKEKKVSCDLVSYS